MMYANVTNTLDPDTCEYQNVATKEEPQQPVDTGRVISLSLVIFIAVWSSLFGLYEYMFFLNRDECHFRRLEQVEPLKV